MSEGCLRFKTIFLSDIHLGTRDCKAQEVTAFLHRSRCEKLVLNGDIIDGWALRRGGAWSEAHTGFVRLVLEKMEHEDMQVVYLRGNHDDILERFLPLQISKLKVETEHIHASPHGRYLVVHGDGFDRVTTNCRWLAMLGSAGYSLLLRLNRAYNRYRNWRGLDYYSLSKSIKARVKSAVSFVSRYEEHLRVLAKQRGCNGIICGHIHSACDQQLDGVHYLNSGDWVESLTAVVEHLDRSFEVLHYQDFLARLGSPLSPPVTARLPGLAAEPARA